VLLVPDIAIVSNESEDGSLPLLYSFAVPNDEDGASMSSLRRRGVLRMICGISRAPVLPRFAPVCRSFSRHTGAEACRDHGSKEYKYPRALSQLHRFLSPHFLLSSYPQFQAPFKPAACLSRLTVIPALHPPKAARHSLSRLFPVPLGRGGRKDYRLTGRIRCVRMLSIPLPHSTPHFLRYSAVISSNIDVCVACTSPRRRSP
jgi:hypothetical protein